MSDWFISKVNKNNYALISYFEKYGEDVCHNILNYDYIECSIHGCNGYLMTNNEGEIGCFLLYVDYEKNSVYVKVLCSNPKYTGSGHCIKLMNHFIQECKNQGKKAVLLNPASNTARMYYVNNFNFQEDEYSWDLILKL